MFDTKKEVNPCCVTKALKFFGRSNNKIERKETIKNRHGHFILFSFHRERDLLRMTNMQKKNIQQSQSVIYFHLLVSFFLYFPDAELCVRCTVCWKSFKHPMSLTLHKDVHKENKTKCPVCARVFSRSYDMKSHLTRIHKITWVVDNNEKDIFY